MPDQFCVQLEPATPSKGGPNTDKGIHGAVNDTALSVFL